MEGEALELRFQPCTREEQPSFFEVYVIIGNLDF